MLGRRDLVEVGGEIMGSVKMTKIIKTYIKIVKIFPKKMWYKPTQLLYCK